MNKIALSLLTTLALVVHLDWRDWTLARSFSGVQRNAAAVALSPLKITDVDFDMGESPFTGWYQGAFIDCIQPPSTPKDIKRSKEDPTYWDRHSQKCVDEFKKEYNDTGLISGLLDKLEGEVHFHFHTADLGKLSVSVKGGLDTFAVPSDSVAKDKDREGTTYITMRVTFHEPRRVTYVMVFGDQYSINDPIVGTAVRADTAIYFPDRNNHLRRLPFDTLEDSILNDAAQQGESATDWKEAYRRLRVSTQSELYKLPLLDVEAPASIVAVMLFLISSGSINQLRYAIRRSRLKAIADGGSDEAFWLTTFKRSPLLRIGYCLVCVTPLIVLWVCFEVWSRNGFTSNRLLSISVEMACMLGLIIEAWVCIAAFHTFVSSELVVKDNIKG